MAENRNFSRDLVGKTIVSKAGKKFGFVGDLVFESRTGEIIYIALKTPTAHASGLDLEKGRSGDLLIPFSAVMSTGDFVIVSEEDIV